MAETASALDDHGRHVGTAAGQRRAREITRVRLVLNQEDAHGGECPWSWIGRDALRRRRASAIGYGREVHRERRALTFTSTLGAHRPAVQLDEIAHQRQTETEPTMSSGARGIGLPEALEDVRKKRRTDPVSRILHHQPCERARHAELDVDRATGSENLTAFDSRLTMICCSRSWSPTTGGSADRDWCEPQSAWPLPTA